MKLSYYILTFALLMLIMFSHTEFLDPDKGISADSLYYRQMALEPMVWQADPWSYRIGNPAIATWLHDVGIPLNLAFILMTISFTLLTVWLLYPLAQTYRLRGWHAAIPGFLYLTTFWLTRFPVSTPWLCDPLMNLVLIAGIYCIRRRWLWPLMSLIVIGTFVKLTVLLLPVYFLFMNRKVTWHTCLQALLITFPAILVAVVLRSSVWYANYIPNDYYTLDVVMYCLNYKNDTESIWLVYGFLFILAATAMGPQMRRLSLVLIIMCVLMRFIDADIGRLVAIVFFVPVAIGTAQAVKRGKLGMYAATCLIGMHFIFHYPWGIINLASEYKMLLSIIPLIVAGLIFPRRESLENQVTYYNTGM